MDLSQNRGIEENKHQNQERHRRNLQKTEMSSLFSAVSHSWRCLIYMSEQNFTNINQRVTSSALAGVK